MTLTLNNRTHPTVEVLQINIVNKTVDFRNRDGICNTPFISVADIPTEAELKIAIEAVLGETVATP